MPHHTPRTPIADAPLSVLLLAGADLDQDVITGWAAFLETLNRPWEILLVQDGPNEAACRLADDLAQRLPRLQVHRHPVARGIGAAMQTGLAAAQYPLLAYAPADKQFTSGDLQALLTRINQVDLVIGVRATGPVPNWLRVVDIAWRWFARIVLGYPLPPRTTWLGWSGWGRRWLARWIFGVRVDDPECPFRLVRRELFCRIPLQSQSAFVHLEILAKANHLGAWIDQTPVSWNRPPWTDSIPKKQLRAEAYRLFKHPDFGLVDLKPSPAWEPPPPPTNKPPAVPDGGGSVQNVVT